MKTENQRKLKGSVLLTVVSVLSIMIIFMTCALAMAAAANKRSRKTYSSSQSSYTARTAIDSILAAIGTDKDFSKSVRALKSKGQKMDILVDVNDPSMGYIENATIENIGTKVLYDSEKGQWVERNLFSINADVTIGGETTTITSKILQDPPAKAKGEGQGGAAFLTYGDMTAIQKVLGFGGTYIGMGQWEDTDGHTYKWNNVSDPDHSLMYYYWKPVGGDYTNPNYFITLKDKKYLTGKDYGVKNASFYEAPWVVNGSFETKTKVGVVYTYQDTGIMNNGAEIWGDLNLPQNPSDFTVRGTDKLANYLSIHGYDFMSMPYFYIDGTLNTNGDVSMTFGHKDLPLNIFMGRINENASAKREFYGDLYLMDSGADNKLSVNNGTKLYNWASSTVTKSGNVSTVGGGIYCNGNLELASNGLDIGGNLIVEGDLTITGNSDVSVGGDIAVGGNFYYNADSKFTVGGNVYTNDPGKSIGGGKKFDDEHFEEKTVEEEVSRIYNAHYMVNPYYGNTFPGVWVMADKLADAQAEAGVTGLDFGGKDVNPDYVYDKIDWLSDADKAAKASVTQTISRTAYVNKETGDEVNKDDCYIAAGDITTKDISDYKDTHDKRVYPKYATRDVLIGAERFLNVKGVADRVIKYGEVPTDKLTAMQNNIVDYTSGGTTIDMNCTLTGTFTDKVIVKPPLDEDIYIRLNNVDFFCKEEEVDGKTEVTNTSYIEIDETESGTGHAYFVYDGFVTSNYDFDQDLTDTRLVKTVYDWMSEFKFDSVDQNNIGHEGTVYGNGDAVGKDYEINEAQPGGGFKTNKVKIQDYTKLPKDSDGRYLITADTTLVGEYGNTKFKVVAPANADIWLTLDGTTYKTRFANDSDIMVDDVTNPGTGNVNMYLKGTVSFQTNNVLEGISSKYVVDTLNKPDGKLNIVSRRDTATLAKIVNNLDQANDTIPTLDPLRTIIYAADGARLTMENGAMVTGYIKAPKTLTVDVAAEKDFPELYNKIYYDGMPLSKLGDSSYIQEGVSKRIGFIGMLNALNVTDKSQNDWFLLYDAPGGGGGNGTGSVDDAEGLHKYDAVEYVAYAR